MLIENFPHDRYMKVLNLSGFPKNALEFEESQDLFQQTMYVDYQLMLLLRDDGKTAARSSRPENPDPIDKISDLIAHAHSVDANYSSTNKRYYEQLYHLVVLANLYHAKRDFEGSRKTLEGVNLNIGKFDSQVQADFLAYLAARFYALLGASLEDFASCWTDYLVNLKLYGSKSSVAANEWKEVILKYSLSFLTANENNPLEFQDVLSQMSSGSECSVVAIANFAVRPENAMYVLKVFRSEYVMYLENILARKIEQTLEFPNASSTASLEVDFVESLYESLNDISDHRWVVNFILWPSTSKKFLLNMTEKTYQSQIVLLNLVRNLIDTKEYDEALGAFKTYATYVDKDAQQHGGATPNILEVIDVYATCIHAFNPLRSIIADSNSQDKKFKYNSTESVVEDLHAFAISLSSYLHKFASLAELRYDEETGAFSENPLSFLYHRYNTNFPSNDKGKVVRILSKAWFALGNFYYYLTTHESADASTLETNLSKVRLYYKNSLIINSTGNVDYLFNYALLLAQSQSLSAALRLCKFVLNRYPESFKTWNLLVLLSSALEQQSSSEDNTAKSFENASLLDSLVEGEQLDGVKIAEKTNCHRASTQLEKFIDDALSIAGLHMKKVEESGGVLPFQIKYELLQLKMTQIAVWEANQGVEYILDFVVEVLVMFRELFPRTFDVPDAEPIQPGVSRAEGRWSHRPSVMDPADVTVLKSKGKTKDKTLAKERIQKLSQVAQDVAPKKAASNEAAPNEPASKQAAKKRTRLLAHIGPIRRPHTDTKQEEDRTLQEIWLWIASIYLKLGLLEEAEQCIVEAETVAKPNVTTYTYLGLLTSKSRKFLSLQEYERSLEVFHSPEERFNRKAYGSTLLGMCKLFITDDESDNSLFISSKDRDAGLIRLKNYLEQYSLCWPYGSNSPELWYYLSTIYQKFDDKVLNRKALWKCVELETSRPVRSYSVCEDFYTTI